MAKTPYELWQEDKKRRETAPTFREASKASRIQYTNPHYQPRSDKPDTTYKWEKSALEGIKGKSNNEKFDKLTKAAGMDKYEAQEFRKYLDAQEDSKQTIRTNKDGSVSKNQTVHPGQGMKLQSDVTDSIIQQSNKRAKQQIELQKKKQKQEEKVTKDSKKERDGLLGFLDSTLGRVGKSAHGVLPDWFEKQQNENYRKLAENSDNPIHQQRLNTVDRKAEGLLEKGSDITGMILGEIAPYTFGYGVADKALKATKLASFAKGGSFTKDLVRGAAAGAIVGTGKTVAEDIGSDLEAMDYVKRVGLETALAGGGDAVFGTVFRLVKNLRTKGASTEQIAQELNTSPEVVEREFIRGTLPGQELVDIVPPNNRLNAPKEPYQKWLDGEVSQPTDTLGLNEPLYRRTVEGVGKDVNIEGIPQLNAPRFNQAVQSNEIPGLEQELDNLFKRRQADEDDFVRSEMAPYDDMLKRSSEADMVWNDSVKKSKEMVENIKKSYGKISVPEGNWADWGHEVPVQFRANRGTNESGIDLYTFADNEGFSSVDEAVQFLKQLDAESKVKLKDLKPADDMKIKPEDYSGLEEIARQKFQQTDTAKAADSLFDELNAMFKSGNEVASTGEPLSFMQSKLFKTRKDPVSFVGRMDPKDASAVRSEGSYSTRFKETPTGDTLEIHPEKPIEFKATQEVRTPRKPVEEKGQGNYRPKQETVVETEPIKPAEGAPKEFKLRSNLQFFNQTEMNSMVSTSAKKKTVSVIDHIKNPVMRKIHKFYEGYVSRTHSAKLLDKAYGTELDKTLQNEAASGSMAKNFLDRHFSSLQKSLGKKSTDKDMADALEYQMAKNLLFNKAKNPDYKLPQGWDWERLANVEGAGTGKYDEFTNSFRSLTQEWRDTMLEYGMIDKKAYDALGENPFYVPMYRDLEFRKDNIDLGAVHGKRQGKRGADLLILHDWEAGDLNTFYANPLETVINNTFKLYNNALKNDTGLQFKKIAEADSEGMFVKKITEKEYQSGGGVEVFVDGTKEYYRPQADMRNLMDELDTGLELDVIGKATSLYARLKTSSLEYQTGAVIRDISQSFVTSQAGPIRWLQHAITAMKNKSVNAKKIGATFHQAYSDHVGGIDPSKVTQEYAKQNARVNNIDLKSKEGLKTLGNVLKKVLELPLKPAQMVGQWSDNLPREIEVLEAQRRFQKQHGSKVSEIESRIAEIDTQIANAQGAPDFDPSTQGIDNLAQERIDLDNQLMDFKRNLRREEIYRARDVINYSRMGRGKIAKKIRQYVIFANTTTQSKDKIIRSFMERPGATLAKAGIVTAPFVVAQQIMMDNMGKEDRKLYDETPDYIKNFNYVYVSDGSVYTIPKVHELALITNPMEQLMAGESLDSSAKLAVKETVPYQIGNIAQGLVPQGGKVDVTDNAQTPGMVGMPAFDTLVNRKTSFNQKPISFGDLRQNKEGIKANKWTNEALKIISNSPKADYSEYLIRQYGGDAGKYALAGLDFMASDKKDRTDRLLEQLNPVQDRVYREGSKWLKDPIRIEKK